MSNPAVSNGELIKKVSGIITRREMSADAKGTVIQLTGADLGWHLAHNDAPLWFNFRYATLDKLANACLFPEEVFSKVRPGRYNAPNNWGFNEIAYSNSANRIMKQGDKKNEASEIERALQLSRLEWLSVQTQAAKDAIAFFVAQPGQKMSDVLIMWARRQGLLVNVSVDGDLLFFVPDYTQPATYQINHSSEAPFSAKNNVKQARKTDDLNSIYSHVTVVAENPISKRSNETALRRWVITVGRLYGRATSEDLFSSASAPETTDPLAGLTDDLTGQTEFPQLPFRRAAVIPDGEVGRKSTATRRAEWFIERNLFDAYTLQYTVAGHVQNGKFWESDTICDVRDYVFGVNDTWYVSDVKCTRDMNNGDQTEVTLHPKGLMREIAINQYKED
jgi:hypothetical protein